METTIFQKRTDAIKRIEDAIFATGNVDQIKRMPDGHIIITFILPVAIGGRFSGIELDGLRLDARQGLAKALSQGLAKIKALEEQCKN